MRKNCVSIDLDNKLKIILEHVYSDCTLILCLNSTFLTGLFINHQWWPRMGLPFWSNHQQFVIILVRITWNGLRSGNQQSAMFDLLRTVRNLKKKKKFITNTKKNWSAQKSGSSNPLDASAMWTARWSKLKFQEMLTAGRLSQNRSNNKLGLYIKKR